MSVTAAMLLIHLLAGGANEQTFFPPPPADAVGVSVLEPRLEQLKAVRFQQRTHWPSCPSIAHYDSVLAEPEWRRCGFAGADWMEHLEDSTGSMERVFTRSEAWVADKQRLGVVVIVRVSVPADTQPSGDLTTMVTVFLAKGEPAIQSLVTDLFGRSCTPLPASHRERGN